MRCIHILLSHVTQIPLLYSFGHMPLLQLWPAFCPHNRENSTVFCYLSIHVSLFWYCMDVRDWFQRVPWNSPIMRHLCFLLILEGLDAVPALLDTRMYTAVSKFCHVLPVLGKKNPWFDVLKWEKDGLLKFWYFQKTNFNLFPRASTWFCDSLSLQYIAPSYYISNFGGIVEIAIIRKKAVVLN